MRNGYGLLANKLVNMMHDDMYNSERKSEKLSEKVNDDCNLIYSCSEYNSDAVYFEDSIITGNVFNSPNLRKKEKMLYLKIVKSDNTPTGIPTYIFEFEVWCTNDDPVDESDTDEYEIDPYYDFNKFNSKDYMEFIENEPNAFVRSVMLAFVAAADECYSYFGMVDNMNICDLSDEQFCKYKTESTKTQYNLYETLYWNMTYNGGSELDFPLGLTVLLPEKGIASTNYDILFEVSKWEMGEDEIEYPSLAEIQLVLNITHYKRTVPIILKRICDIDPHYSEYMYLSVITLCLFVLEELNRDDNPIKS